jgi:hypothetical protein
MLLCVKLQPTLSFILKQMNSGLAALIQDEELKLPMQSSLTQKPSKLNSRESSCSMVSLPWHTSAQLAGHGLNPKMTSNIQVGVDQTTTRNVSEKLIEAWVTGRFGSDFKKALRQADKILSEEVVHQGQKEISDWPSPSRALKGGSSFKVANFVDPHPIQETTRSSNALSRIQKEL